MRTLYAGMLAVAAALPMAGTVGAAEYVVSGVDSANIHTGPSSYFPSVGQLSRNQTITVYGCANGWCQIAIQGGTGYIAQEYVGVSQAPSLVSRGSFSGAVDGVDSANVRSGPGTNYPVIGEVYRNQGIYVAGCNLGWCQIYLQTGFGFISQTYVRAY